MQRLYKGFAITQNHFHPCIQQRLAAKLRELNLNPDQLV